MMQNTKLNSSVLWISVLRIGCLGMIVCSGLQAHLAWAGRPHSEIYYLGAIERQHPQTGELGYQVIAKELILNISQDIQNPINLHFYGRAPQYPGQSGSGGWYMPSSGVQGALERKEFFEHSPVGFLGIGVCTNQGGVGHGGKFAHFRMIMDPTGLGRSISVGSWIPKAKFDEGYLYWRDPEFLRLKNDVAAFLNQDQGAALPPPPPPPYSEK